MMSTERRPEGAAAKRTFDTWIVSASQVVGVALQHLLEDRLDGLSASRLDLGELLACPSDFGPDLLVLAPQNWEDLSLWLPHVRSRFASCPWLLFSEPRTCGIYLSQLEGHAWVLVPTTGSPALLRTAIQSITSRGARLLPVDRHQPFTTLFQTARTYLNGTGPTIAEIQCACAVSLGLSDRETARLLQLRVADVRGHVRRLVESMEVRRREDLAESVRQLLNSARVASICQEQFESGADDPHLPL